jgi:hypothetical protein
LSTADIEMKEACATSFAIEMHVTGMKTGVKSEIASSVNGAMRGIMITMAPTMTNPTVIALRLEDAMKGDQAFLSQLEEGMLAHELQAIGD